ncbi:MAG: MFS transporter [Halanaerobiaceae bacterium]
MPVQKNKRDQVLLVIILVMGAFGVMGGSLLAPALPAIGKAFGVGNDQVGLVLSFYTFSAALSLPVIGYLIDSWGRRKMGLICLSLDGVFGLLAILAPSFPYLLFFRFIQGIGVAGLIPVAMTIISDWYEGDTRLKKMGYLSGVISLGAVVIPLLGGVLAEINWKLVFGVYSFSLGLALFFLIYIPETAPRIIENEKSELEESRLKEYVFSLGQVFKLKTIIQIFVHSFVTFFLLYTLVTYFPLFLNRIHGFSEFFSGLALSLQGLFAAVVAAKADRFSDFKWEQRIGFGFVLIAVCFLLLPFWQAGSFLVFISVILFGLGMGFATPVLYNQASRLPPDELSGSVIALFNSMKYIGMSTSPVLLGFLLKYISYRRMFLLVGLVTIFWALITLIVSRK